MPTPMKLLDILSPEAIKVPLVATDKKAAIEELVDLLAGASLVVDPEQVKSAVWDREVQRSTGIGEGLAIPHGRCGCITSLQLAVGRPATPMDYNAIDKKPIQLLMLLASPVDKNSDHIQALGKISRLGANPEFREKAYHAQSSEEMYYLFEQYDP
jgi:mannitol/fructose-specific phosphotransferase system IIA component (Ntr-type)